ncbi:MAG TPA: LacI family DNA-binding transcriptional regulator [Verrucomicrobiae bacterium]|nr:LacI family DNA-binding transcriptional regulator [Verrucomicrobiae bacterium]
MKKKDSVSQQRIAHDLGVSQALVSMVLNGKRENISEDSYRRIWDHALKIGYRPKGMQLNGHTTTNVGFILRSGLRLHTQSNFFSHVQHGLHAGLLAHGYHSVFLGSEDDLGVRTVQQKLRKHQLFGLAVLGQVDEKFLKAIKAVQPNLVAISVSYPGICHSVMPNEQQALNLLVDHLTGLSHRQFAWVGGDRGLDYNLRRHAGLVEALNQHGLKLADKFTVNVESGDRLGGWKAGEIMLGQISRKNFPTGWICANGLMARGVINCLMQNGWRVPEEISVVAVDATRVCEEENPQITGAHADPERIGVTAAELLLKYSDSEDESPMDVLLPAHLTVRQTSAPATT